MKANLIYAASAVIPNQQILVNMMSRRVRQLSVGARPLVVVPPGTGMADTALTEIIEKKLTFELLSAADATKAAVIQFPAPAVGKKKAA